MAHVKNIKVHNPKNTIVQIPGFITSTKWGLITGDQVEVHVSDDGQEVIIRPKKIRSGSPIDGKGERMA